MVGKSFRTPFASHDLRTQDLKDDVSYSARPFMHQNFKPCCRFFSRQVEHVGQYRIPLTITQHGWFQMDSNIDNVLCRWPLLLKHIVFKTLGLKIDDTATTWAPTSCKWSYDLYKWPYTWVTGVITLLIGAITPFTTGRETPCTSSGNFVNSVSFTIFPWEANTSSTTARRCIAEEQSTGFG